MTIALVVRLPYPRDCRRSPSGRERRPGRGEGSSLGGRLRSDRLCVRETSLRRRRGRSERDTVIQEELVLDHSSDYRNHPYLVVCANVVCAWVVPKLERAWKQSCSAWYTAFCDFPIIAYRTPVKAPALQNPPVHTPPQHTSKPSKPLQRPPIWKEISWQSVMFGYVSDCIVKLW